MANIYYLFCPYCGSANLRLAVNGYVDAWDEEMPDFTKLALADKDVTCLNCDELFPESSALKESDREGWEDERFNE